MQLFKNHIPRNFLFKVFIMVYNVSHFQNEIKWLLEEVVRSLTCVSVSITLRNDTLLSTISTLRKLLSKGRYKQKKCSLSVKSKSIFNLNKF